MATLTGAGAAAKALRDETRWDVIRRDPDYETAAALYDGLRPIETVLTADQIAEVDRRIGAPHALPTGGIA